MFMKNRWEFESGRVLSPAKGVPKMYLLYGHAASLVKKRSLFNIVMTWCGKLSLERVRRSHWV